MKEFFKNFFANKYIQNIIAWLLYFYINLVFKTSKVIIKGDYEKILKYVNSGKGIVLFTWHGRTLVSPTELKRMFREELKNDKKKIVALSSVHRDGRIVAEIMDKFNIGSIGGSTIDPKKGSKKNKKSLSSIRNIMRSLENGKICVLAADGPRGPVFKMNTKIAELVRKTDTAIACVAISYKRKKQFNTWDFFQLAWPFNKIIVNYGNLIKIEKDENIEKINIQLENEINELIKNNDEKIIK